MNHDFSACQRAITLRLGGGSVLHISQALGRSKALAGIASLSLPGLLRMRTEANEKVKRERTALLVVWLHGGASHLETYDPKPLAPSEYRGPFRPIATTVPGLQLCELLPQHAALAKRFTMLRSLIHTGPCHDSGPQQIFTGYPTKEPSQNYFPLFLFLGCGL
jgi:Protein of unknown function (DUF1501)